MIARPLMSAKAAPSATSGSTLAGASVSVMIHRASGLLPADAAAVATKMRPSRARAGPLHREAARVSGGENGWNKKIYSDEADQSAKHS